MIATPILNFDRNSYVYKEWCRITYYLSTYNIFLQIPTTVPHMYLLNIYGSCTSNLLECIWGNTGPPTDYPTGFQSAITQSTGKRLRPSTENKTVLPGGSRKLYISARKVMELWIETRAVISWVMPTTAFLMWQLIVASRLGRTEYQLLLMKISWWDRNVKIRCKCLAVIDEFLTVPYKL